MVEKSVPPPHHRHYLIIRIFKKNSHLTGGKIKIEYKNTASVWGLFFGQFPFSALCCETMDNHHNRIQKILRGNVRNLLRRHPASISFHQFDRYFSSVRGKAKKKLSLFTERSNRLFWKPHITLAHLRKLNLTNSHAIESLFKESYKYSKRSKFPFITPSNKKNQIRDAYHLSGHCYGFDLLIRKPISLIDKTNQDEEARLHVGKLSFAFVLHIAFNASGSAVYTPDSGIRIVWGSALSKTPLFENLRGNISSLESIAPHLITGCQYSDFCEKSLTIANQAASFSFPN